MKSWLKFFRIVNLPTVPGDVLAGAAAIASVLHLGTDGVLLPLVAAAAASSCLYLAGLADNDLVGAATDGPERPIPAGEISLRAARLARGFCLFLALAAGAVGGLPPAWWIASVALVALVFLYNRRKIPFVMGLCRGLDVACGGLALTGLTALTPSATLALAALALVWTAYIAGVTKYSEGESESPSRRAFVGFLIGALVYLQLLALVVSYLFVPTSLTRALLLAGAALLVVLRILRRSLPEISGS